MSNYSYVAVDPHGAETRGTLEVQDQFEALRRIKEMGLYPTRVLEARHASTSQMAGVHPKPGWVGRQFHVSIPGLWGGVRPRTLSVFTRQLATLVDAGMPLLRGLRTLQEQQESVPMKRVIAGLANSIEGGSSLTDAVAARPRVFNRLYVNMVKAGEIGGALDVTLQRLAEFMEKSARIKGKVKAGLFYPCAVLVVAVAIVCVMMTFVVPRFKAVFDGLLGGRPMPPFTLFVLQISDAIKNHLPCVAGTVLALAVFFGLSLRTQWGRLAFDQFKLAVPLLGPVFRKAAIARFSRTLGTLASSGCRSCSLGDREGNRGQSGARARHPRRA